MGSTQPGGEGWWGRQARWHALVPRLRHVSGRVAAAPGDRIDAPDGEPPGPISNCMAPAASSRGRQVAHQGALVLDRIRAHERDALLLPARKLAWQSISKAFEANHGQHFHDHRPAPVATYAPRFEGKANIGGYCHMGKQRVILEHHPDVPPIRRQSRNVATMQANGAVVGVQRPQLSWPGWIG